MIVVHENTLNKVFLSKFLLSFDSFGSLLPEDQLWELTSEGRLWNPACSLPQSNGLGGGGASSVAFGGF